MTTWTKEINFCSYTKKIYYGIHSIKLVEEMYMNIKKMLIKL